MSLRSWPINAAAACLFVFAATQCIVLSSAHPFLWPECKNPSATSFPADAHQSMGPIPDSATVFTILDGTKAVTSICLSRTYKFKAVFASPRQALFITSVGKWTDLDAKQVDPDTPCGGRRAIFFDNNNEDATTSVWQATLDLTSAPCSTKEVVISVTSGIEETQRLRESSLTLPVAAGCKCTPPPPAPAPAPTPKPAPKPKPTKLKLTGKTRQCHTVKFTTRDTKLKKTSSTNICLCATPSFTKPTLTPAACKTRTFAKTPILSPPTPSYAKAPAKICTTVTPPTLPALTTKFCSIKSNVLVCKVKGPKKGAVKTWCVCRQGKKWTAVVGKASGINGCKK